MKNYIGIDNGVSGSIGIILFSSNEYTYVPTPVKRVLGYTKAKQWLNRVDLPKILKELDVPNKEQTLAIIERPMVNPGRFKATASALRALETTLIALEQLGIAYQYIDSKEWQKVMLPSGLKGEELKEASWQVGKRLFPTIAWSQFKDADGILIAEYARRSGM